jgi:hypothetical protein
VGTAAWCDKIPTDLEAALVGYNLLMMSITACG